jgi:serine/threonine protein phosphatase PrpC
MELLAWGATACGLVRAFNEDGFRVLRWDHGGLLVVADGMGGMRQCCTEDVLSAIEAVYEGADKETVLQEATLTAALDAGRAALAAANGGPGLGAGSGCALVLLVVAGEVGQLAWAGDCRLWRLRGRLLEQLTVDHSLDVARAAVGLASVPGGANILTRVLTEREDATSQVESVQLGLVAGDRFLLATDGVWRSQGLLQLQRVLQGAVEDAAGDLLAAAMAADGKDNGAVVAASWAQK